MRVPWALPTIPDWPAWPWKSRLPAAFQQSYLYAGGGDLNPYRGSLACHGPCRQDGILEVADGGGDTMGQKEDISRIGGPDTVVCGWLEPSCASALGMWKEASPFVTEQRASPLTGCQAKVSSRGKWP